MYELKNGILYQDGKPIIALGVSYYASFHEANTPCLLMVIALGK